MAVTPEVYCREIEAYLTRKNEGHLVRIVGPSFERVRGWAEQGIPLKVAFHGIDRYCERYYAKGPRRRPVHIDHCEADVLDVFDEWRRAVGVTTGHREDADEVPERPRDSLATRLERAVARLTALRGGSASLVPSDLLERIVSELDRMTPMTRTARGHAREALTDRLAAIDRELINAVRQTAGPAVLSGLRTQAADDLRPFADRMPEAAWTQALDAAVDRALRESAGLPVLAGI